MKLNQVIAIEQGVKSKGNTQKSELYKIAQKPKLFNGFIKKYRANAEGGEKFPDEKDKVQFKAPDLITDVGSCLRSLFDIEARKDFANCLAKADIMVDGAVLVKDVPSTFLLYLSKELANLSTFVEALPTLSEDEEWTLDKAVNLYKTAVVESIKTKKVQKALVLLAPTKEHPGQAQIITDDEIIGYWDTVKHSGALHIDEKRQLLKKVQQLADAVKVALEQANMIDATPQDAGTILIGWLLGGKN
jgi:hypothetical protein